MRRAPQFDAHIVETHHAAKKDAPSGTAIALDRAASSELARPIPITSVRTGHVPGTHELFFDGPFEQIRLTHAARGNARGATTLLERGAGNLERYAPAPPHGIDVAGLVSWARDLAIRPTHRGTGPRLRD